MSNELHISVSSSSKRFLNEYKRENALRSYSDCINQLIEEYQENQPDRQQVLAKEIVKALYEEHGKEQTRIRLAATTADINSQVIIEILNSILYAMNADQYFPTEEIKSEVVAQAEIAVRGRIARYKVMRDSREAVKAEKNAREKKQPL